jgi:hypothetical protein
MKEKRLEQQAAAEMRLSSARLRISNPDRLSLSPPMATELWLEDWLGEGFFSDTTVLIVDGSMTDAGLEHVGSFRHLRELRINKSRLTANGLQKLRVLRGLEVLSLDRASTTDTGLEFLDSLPRLSSLHLEWFHPTDGGWQQIRRCAKLRCLSMSCQYIQPDMARLKELSQVEELELIYCFDLRDDDLRHLAGLTQLRSLRLDGAQVTDSGMKHLEGLTRLEDLALNATFVTDDGAERLRQALPHCKVSR